ncbi:uncharacterized protein FFNC_15653 [Fusarium fujikuroi]|nr:uncharacterized protein FFNC_15653 [Fusarium fujikuroi]
MLPNHQKIRQ